MNKTLKFNKKMPLVQENLNFQDQLTHFPRMLLLRINQVAGFY